MALGEPVTCCVLAVMETARYFGAVAFKATKLRARVKPEPSRPVQPIRRAMADLRSFLGELRRRKVYNVAAAYVAVGLALLAAAEGILDPLGLAAARPFVVVLVLFGFPVALVLAWAYEVRPEPSATSAAARSSEAPPPPETAAAPSSSEEAARWSRSIAVLPFDNMSDEPENEYFADGISEELTHELARIADLKVAARTSAFAFREGQKDVREIGSRLGVAHVVEGSVRRFGDRVRITAQLVDTRDGYHLWSERFDRLLDDVFKIQDEIVARVVRSLLERLPSTTTGRPAAMEAYDAYLRALHAYRSLEPGSFDQAVDQAETAIELDPSYAPAHALLAQIIVFLAMGFGWRAPEEIMLRARQAADRAIELDPDLPEAHMARGVLLMFHEWRFAEARRELERAIALGPSLADPHSWMEFYWTYVQRDEDRALAANGRALELSPLDPAHRDRRATVLYIFERYAQAEVAFREMLADGVPGPLPHLGLVDTLGRTGRLDEAIEHVGPMLELGRGATATLGIGAATLAVAGRKDEARALVREMEGLRENGSGSSFWLAVGLAGLGEMDLAFEELDHALDTRDPSLIYLSVVPRQLGIHDDPRYARILDRMGLAHLAVTE